MLQSWPWVNREAVLLFGRRFFKELAISATATLCVSLAFSSLSRHPNLGPIHFWSTGNVVQPATAERSARVEREPVQVMPAPVAVVANVVNTAPATPAPRAPSKAARDRVAAHTATDAAKPVHPKLAAITTAPASEPAYRQVGIDYGPVAAPPLDIRPAAQGSANDHSLNSDFWQRAKSVGAAIADVVPGRKAVSEALDTVQQRIAGVIDVVK